MSNFAGEVILIFSIAFFTLCIGLIVKFYQIDRRLYELEKKK